MTSRGNQGGDAKAGLRRYQTSGRRSGWASGRVGALGGLPLLVAIAATLPPSVPGPVAPSAVGGVVDARSASARAVVRGTERGSVAHCPRHGGVLTPPLRTVATSNPAIAVAMAGAPGGQTLFPMRTTVLVGTPDSGGPASLRAEDAKTYDVRSAYVAAAGGGVADWYATGKIAISPSAVHEITMTYVGQFSKASVVEKVYLYNYAARRWELFDSRDVGDQDDTQVVVTPDRARSYISLSGEMRARVQGIRPGGCSSATWRFFSWANYLSWRIS